jgi:hypothetical protein
MKFYKCLQGLAQNSLGVLLQCNFTPKCAVKKPATKQGPDEITFEASVTTLGHRYRVARGLEEFVTVADEAGVKWRMRPIILVAPSGRLQQA